jgi:hypothetical protein
MTLICLYLVQDNMQTRIRLSSVPNGLIYYPIYKSVDYNVIQFESGNYGPGFAKSAMLLKNRIVRIP